MIYKISQNNNQSINDRKDNEFGVISMMNFITLLKVRHKRHLCPTKKTKLKEIGSIKNTIRYLTINTHS